jgi:hypothetical protein
VSGQGGLGRGGGGRLDGVREQAGLGVLLAVLVKPARAGELGLRADAGTRPCDRSAYTTPSP